ncbi:MAG: GNAT family protein [Candidatus Cloacimonadaceae bacterium]|nr:GNAT family protein [Candidatus Cloacimonadaceae bacterium]
MKYFRKLVGEKCYLSPISIDDAEKYTEWVNDLEVGQFVLFSHGIYDLEKEKELLRDLMKNSMIFAIIENQTNKVIGNCGLNMVNEIHRRATFGIFIGDKTYWGRGVGTEATKLVLDYGFNILNLNNITLEVVAYNNRATRCYEKVGFKYVGTRRNYVYMAGEYHDVMIYDILASEFESPYVKKLFKRSITEDANANRITIV